MSNGELKYIFIIKLTVFRMKKDISRFFEMKKKYTLYFILLIFYFSPAENVSVPIDTQAFLSTNMLLFLNNLEYYNAYREGLPFWGSYLQIRFHYKPFPKIRFSCGIHLRKDFGDENFVSDIRPLFQAWYAHENFSLICGELFNENRHGLLDALLKEQYMYNPVVEEGLQIRYTSDKFKQDLWGIYPALNTPEHREHLCLGNYSVLNLGPFYLTLMGYISHYGGQLFAPENDPVRENLTAAFGVTYTFNLNKRIEEIGIEQFLLGSYTSNLAKITADNYLDGWGGLTHLWLVFFGFKVGLSFFQGHDFITWEGNPMYQSNAPYYFIDCSRSFSFTNRIFLNFGFRFDFLDMYPGDYFKNGDHQIWLNFGGQLTKIFRKKNKQDDT